MLGCAADVVVKHSGEPLCNGLYTLKAGSDPVRFHNTSPRKAGSSIRFSGGGTTAWLHCGRDERHQERLFQATVSHRRVVPRSGWHAVQASREVRTPTVVLGGRCEHGGSLCSITWPLCRDP